KTGDFAHISIPELGISDIFILKDTRVTTIDSRKYSKKESAVDFNPIISTIRRKVKRLGKYKFDSGAEIICTLNHLFYSITRDSYIEIDQIERHEEILTSTGESAKLLSTNLIDTIAEVYNIEVWRDNNYYVGNQHSNEFLLVHNSCWSLRDEIFKMFDFFYSNAVKIEGKLWTHKVSSSDIPLPKEIALSEVIGAYKQERIILTKFGTEGVDAISENVDILSYKIMEGLTAQSNITNLENQVSKAYTSYKKIKNNNIKAEIWIKGDHASSAQIVNQWDQIKVHNLNMSAKSDLISKVFYVDNLGFVTQLLW